MIKIKNETLDNENINMEIKEKLKARKEELIDKYYQKDKQTVIVPEPEYKIEHYPYLYAYEQDRQEIEAMNENDEHEFMELFSDQLTFAKTKVEKA